MQCRPGILVGALASMLLCSAAAIADDRSFTYVYEATVLPEGQWELEQWITNQNGRQDRDYSKWNLRTEFEYGLSEHWQGALYLNWDSTREQGLDGEEDSHESEFKGVSGEVVYQLTNPHLDPIGSALYGEVTTDGIDSELEWKLLLSKNFDDIILAANAIYEMEWEREEGKTEREAELSFTFGASYKLNPRWSVGVEARNVSAYPGGFNLSEQEFQSWSVGPNVHFSTPKWWTTLTVLPQVWGNGDGARGGRNLEHEEALEVRLIFGILL